MKQHIHEIIQRWKDPINKFWKRVLKLAISIIIAGSSVWVANTIWGLDLPSWLLAACKYCIVAGAAFGLSAKLTKS